MIGRTLGHSFSQRYFEEKFALNPLWEACEYALLELENLKDLRDIIRRLGWSGFNVTIPYKEQVLGFLDEISEDAQKIGAVNTVKITSEGRWMGYNTDMEGFLGALGNFRPGQALLLGTGGASKAVRYGLESRGVTVHTVSRAFGNGDYTYEGLSPEQIVKHKLIVNCTPLGSYPDIESCPQIPYEAATEAHLFYDLVYNPPQTQFLKRAATRGARTLNGYQMLINQAEASWKIWTQP